MNSRILVITAAALMLAPFHAMAEGEIDCASSCPDGKTLVAYADGNNTACICFDDAEMSPTERDLTVPEGIPLPQYD